MRVIVNIHTRNLIKIAGWRAKAVQINNGSESNIKEVLDTVVMGNGTALSEILIENNKIKSNFILFVNGVQMPDTPDFNTTVKDNVQIHVMGV